jgi:Transposase DDE domain
MQMMVVGQNSYWAWARELAVVIGSKISKQAIFYRMTTAWVSTLRELVAEVIKQQACKQIKHKLFSGFKNVWIQDSTCVQLPQALIKKFRGSVVNGKQNSVAKLNVIVHALSGLCPQMEWDSYTATEQSLSSTILRVAKAGDLVIRDLGYFVLRIFRKMDEAGIFFLSRWTYKVLLFDIESGKQINLLQRLKGKNYLDVRVLCGRDEQLNVRLVVIKLPQAQKAERIRKAKKG